jgi:rRNA maturation endonuclease Nob1
VADDDVDRIVERYELDRAQAEALAVAIGLRGKRVLVTDDEGVADVARQMDVPFATYEEIRQALKLDEKAVE